MAGAVRIVDAVEMDADDLVAIFSDAVEQYTVTGFMFSHRRVEAVKLQKDFFTPLLRNRFENDQSRIVKAIDESSGKIVGWSALRWSDGNPTEPPKSDPGQSSFLMWYWHQQDKNWRKLTAGKKHVILGSLYVQPECQRRGIGTKLVGHLFEQYDLEKELVFLQTLAGTEMFYSRFGWEVADSTDVDLSEWGGQNRGYGVHKAPQMLRQPGPL